MARLLIAGFGFLGEALRGHFLGCGWEVDLLSRSGSDDAITCDLSDASSVTSLQGEYDLIIHCAASGGGGEDAYRAVYLDGCRNLIGRFPDARLIFISSSSVYGQVDHLPVSEASPAEPAAATSQVLRQAEDLTLASGGSVLRLSALCGPGRCHTLKTFIDGRARLDGDGERVLNFVHRDDAASACRLVSENWDRGQIYNVSALSLTQCECYRQLADHFQRPMPEPATPGDGTRRRGNTSKIVDSSKLRELGWEPSHADILSMGQG